MLRYQHMMKSSSDFCGQRVVRKCMGYLDGGCEAVCLYGYEIIEKDGKIKR